MRQWKGIVGEGFTPEAFDTYVRQLAFGAWRPTLVVLHNTEVPRFAEWHGVAGRKRMRALERYYRDEQGWSAGPHLFVADDLIWVFTPLTVAGVHSPTWNSTSWGVEMVGDYAREELTAGVRDNTVYALASLHAALGLNPAKLRLHREDPRTTHRGCPGKHVDKADIIRRVEAQLAGRMEGEHLESRSLTPTLAPPAAAPVAEAFLAESAAMVAPTAPAGANRGCALRPYPPRAPIPTFTLGGECVAYASPDSTWAVTREMVDGATRTILIGIYDFTSGPVKELLLAARRRGVEVTLMLDVERSDEAAVFDELARAGVRCVAAPACTHPDPARRVFASSHEKVVVVDGEWTLVQSGNYSANGIPVNPEGGGSGFVTGNRETGVAVHSPEIARFFTDLLLSDVALARETADETPLLQTEAAPAAPTLFLAAPATPPKLFPRQRLEPSDGIEVLPVLSPDSYMDVVPPLLAGARASILIEQQYIKARQPATRELLGIVRERLDAVPGLDVRIILGRVFDAGDRKDIQALADDFGLRLGTHVRLINTAHFVHCHNKMVLVDRADVLVGSQNWSDYALTRNREASLLFRSFGALAGYFGRIFEADWENASPELPPPFDPRAILSDAARGTQPVVPLEPGDFVHV